MVSRAVLRRANLGPACANASESWNVVSLPDRGLRHGAECRCQRFGELERGVTLDPWAQVHFDKGGANASESWNVVSREELGRLE